MSRRYAITQRRSQAYRLCCCINEFTTMILKSTRNYYSKPSQTTCRSLIWMNSWTTQSDFKDHFN